MIKLSLLLVLSPLLAFSAGKPADSSVPSRIAFGSCIHQDREHPILDPVIQAEPELFVFLGDNIYGDTHDMQVLKKKYGKLAASPQFKALKADVPLLAIWDDHDYGVNDAGKEYAKREASQQVFQDFWGVPKEDASRMTPGIYREVVCGPPGKRLQILLLDTRYFRSSLGPLVSDWRKQKRAGPYTRVTDPGATILGEAQWEWLEDRLKQPADLRIIASSIQVLPSEHFWECWANMPAERLRLMELLEGGDEPVVFLSGDRHMGELSRMPADDKFGPGREVWEVTSSGLTQAGGGYNEPNRYRMGVKDAYRKRNVGWLLIDWDAGEHPDVHMELRDVDGKVVVEGDYKTP